MRCRKTDRSDGPEGRGGSPARARRFRGLAPTAAFAGLAFLAVAPAVAGPVPAGPLTAGLAALLRIGSAAVHRQDGPSGATAIAADPGKWYQRISLSGDLSGEGRWLETGRGGAASASSDIYLRAVELAVEADVDDWLQATVVVNSEYIGDPLAGDDATVVVDEAHLDITVPHTPLYFVLGKRIQPFGLFESYLVTDLLVQDGYETKAVGLTAGLKAPGDTDVSFTAYKGHIRADHLAQSGLLGPTVPDFPGAPAGRVDSWIVSGLTSPLGDDWRVSASLASEPGDAARQTTLNVGSYLSFPLFENIEFNAEYMKALHRDPFPGLGRTFRESALSVTAAYQLVTQEMKDTAGRNYRARKSRRFAHPFVVALRYEAFDDGGRAEALGAWSVRNRIGAGGRYTFYEKGDIEAALSLEYRIQNVRVSPLFAGPVPASRGLFVRFGLDF